MKSHLLKLFNYDLFANKEILLLLEQCNYPEKPMQIYKHLLAAQQIWLKRILYKEAKAIELWPLPDGKFENLEELLLNTHQGWTSYLHSATENDLLLSLDYQNLKGDKLANEIIDIITHVINHGTHHRAQIGQLLKINNQIDLPFMDYIVYLRKLNS